MHIETLRGLDVQIQNSNNPDSMERAIDVYGAEIIKLGKMGYDVSDYNSAVYLHKVNLAFKRRTQVR